MSEPAQRALGLLPAAAAAVSLVGLLPLFLVAVTLPAMWEAFARVRR